MMDAILRSDFPEITDTKLNESRKYKEISPTSGSVRERVSDMRFIEQCLDTSNFMRIFKLQPYGSQIRADYFIKAYCNEIKANVYVFLRKREESDNYANSSITSSANSDNVYKNLVLPSDL